MSAALKKMQYVGECCRPVIEMEWSNFVSQTEVRTHGSYIHSSLASGLIYRSE